MRSDGFVLTETAQELLSSFLTFTCFFFKELTGRDYYIHQPMSREPRQITMARELTKVFKLETPNLLINIPPGCGKSTILQYWVAWCYAWYPDCNFIYTSLNQSRAETNTYLIKCIMSLPAYRELFGVEIRKDSKAKGRFITTAGGVCCAYGASAGVTGENAGFPDCDRFNGALIMDDNHDAKDVFSDTERQKVIDGYINALRMRLRSPKVPCVYLGQRLHELDICSYFLSGEDSRGEWHHLELPALDSHNNNLCDDVHKTDYLLNLKQKSPYVFWSQMQQKPTPVGDSVYREEDFKLLDVEPNILKTFLTVDTAETDKTYNDATVFSFWGIYKVMDDFIETDVYALHWLGCHEIRVEPRYLRDEFMNFYAGCMTHPVKPTLIGIEKKSTGVTLSSVLKEVQGLRIYDIQRTKADWDPLAPSRSISKRARFADCQPFIASKLISFTRYAPHVKMCIEHMTKITLNNSHAFDDVADTCCDAIKLALIDKIILNEYNKKSSTSLSFYDQHSREQMSSYLQAWK